VVKVCFCNVKSEWAKQEKNKHKKILVIIRVTTWMAFMVVLWGFTTSWPLYQCQGKMMPIIKGMQYSP